MEFDDGVGEGEEAIVELVGCGELIQQPPGSWKGPTMATGRNR